MEEQHKQRIIQEFVPGKQVTMAHLIANPDPDLYKKLGVIGERTGALGILTITPWDPSLIHAIEHALLVSDIGINPTDDGRVIRLVFPAPTEERRRQLTKDVQKLGEETKVAVRNIRRDAMDKLKAQKKNSEITEDDQKHYEEEMQKITDKYVKLVDKACEEKNKEIMEI